MARLVSLEVGRYTYTSNFVCSSKSGVRASSVHIQKEKPQKGSPWQERQESILRAQGPLWAGDFFFFFFFFFFWLKLDLNFGAGSLVAAKSTAMHKSFSPPSNSSQSPGDPRDQGGPKDRATGDEFKKGKKEQSTYLPQPHPKCFARILSSVI